MDPKRVEDPDGFYMGMLADGKKNGYGKYEYNDGTSHEGEFMDDKLYDGEGTIKYPDGSIYEGRIIDYKKKHTGKLTNADGSIFHDGEWV